MKFDLASFFFGGVAVGLIDFLFVAVTELSFKKHTGGSFRELYKDNKDSGKGENDK